MGRRLRIVVLGDSLAMPRNEGGDQLRWEHTWPYLLQTRLVNAEVINCSSRAKSSVKLCQGSDVDEHMFLKQPDVAIVQVGIVDCAPRLFSLREKQILAKLPQAVRDRAIAFMSARRAAITSRAPLAKVEVKPETFVASLRRFVRESRTKCPTASFVFVPIVADVSVMEKKSPGISGNLALYNSLLTELCRQEAAELAPVTEEFGSANASLYCSDGYHLNVAGSDMLAGLLERLIMARWSHPPMTSA